MSYKIEYIQRPVEDIIFQPLEDGKTNFYSNNMSLTVCAAMILGEGEARGDFHRLLYGRYLAGFAFEGYDMLPPLCILQTVREDKAVNALYHNGMIYDPKFGVFSSAEYEKQDTAVLGYVQIYIPEAYENTDWKPYIPAEIRAEFEKDAELAKFFQIMPSMQQSKILNYIYPFSKPSSFKENRASTKPITQTNTQKIISHIKSFMSSPQTDMSVYDELRKFETIEAVETLKKCGITEGMTVLDMGCGHGHYTFAASIATGSGGKVIAVDLDKKVLNYTETKSSEFDLKNIVFLRTSEKELNGYKESIEFIILYDVLHGLPDQKTTKLEFIGSLVSLLKPNGILSLALYDEIEHKKVAVKTKDGNESVKYIKVPHDEAIQPYIELMRASGLELSGVIENGGVHFDDFHNPSKWRKFGEIKISSLDRRNIYNFVKIYKNKTEE
jgi:2-polyprenyl-3-methyl-5-hydroxy-6-metoxy-1,4-benzoquinol methylase